MRAACAPPCGARTLLRLQAWQRASAAAAYVPAAGSQPQPAALCASARRAIAARSLRAAATDPAAAAPLLSFADGAPRVLAFCSRDSGPQIGSALASKLRQAVGASQTWELPGDARGGPENAAAALAAAAVEAHAAGTPAPRVVVCGGDGTASWVLAALHAVWPTDVPPPAFAVLPLGTGNDLARVTGWADCRIARDALAAEASPSDVLELLRVVEAAVATPLDWWRLTVESAAADTTPSGVSAAVPAGADAAASAAPAARELFWTNYVSVGFDAGVALAFDGARRAAPSLFASRAGNKAAYGLLGARDFALGACADLPEHLTLHADGRRVALPEGARGVLLLNISSFMGGARPWPDEPAPGGADGGLNTNAAPYDGALEVAAHYGALHLAAINLGLAAAVPLAVAREVLVSTSAPLPMQADGEAWAQPGPAVLRVSWQGSVSVLHAPALE